LLRAYVTDLDADGKVVTDRKRQNYRLLVDGVPQTPPSKVRHFQELGEAIALTFVVQVSPTIKPTLTEAVESMKRLVDALPIGSKIGLVAYTDVGRAKRRPHHTGAGQALDR
jgi:hypothetical protein